jgi:PAS domain S-box-containing protein
LELARAHCEFASGVIAEAEERLRSLSLRAGTTAERVAVACLQVDIYQGIDRSDEAVAVGLRALRNLGVDFPERPTEADARRAYDGIWSRLGARAIEDLIDLPLMSDPDSLAVLDLLIRVAVPGFFDSCHLFAVAVCTAVSLGLERGHSDASCIAYVQLGTLAGPHFGQFDAGYRFGRLGCELVERPGLQRFQARTFETFGFVVPWTQHVRKGRQFLFRGFDLANRLGEISYAGYACGQLNTNYLMAGDPLIEVQEQAEHGLAFARKVGFGTLEGWILGQLGLVRSLRGLTTGLGCFDDATFREGNLERDLAGNAALALPECWYYIRKLQARFLAGEYADALQAASRAQPMLWNTVSLLEVVEYHFYDALCRAAVHESASSEDRKDHHARATQHLEKLDTWALHCPENFANRAALVGAELARIEGRELDAERLYERAISSARAADLVHNEALANELAGRFYLARDFGRIANAYFREARDCYLRWGADAKVRQLEERYPQIRAEKASSDAGTILASVEQLDLATVIRVSEAVSGEIEQEKLIDTLMRTAIEYAGAERGLLILPRANEYRIEAEATTGVDGLIVALRQAEITDTDLPASVFQCVRRTRESLLLHDAAAHGSFSTDEYIHQRGIRSLLCLPLLKQTRLLGVLYLENNLARDVFTPARMTVLKLLASAAAVSLENTRLYSDLREREARVRRLVDSNIIGIFIWDVDGLIIDANEAFLHIVGHDRDDLLAGRLNWRQLTPTEWREHDDRALAAVKMTGIAEAYEKELFGKGGARVPVLAGAAIFDRVRNEGVAFMVDLSDRKRAEDAARESERRYHDIQIQLEHANRVATLGQLSASIAHEVNQPITGVATNAHTALLHLRSEVPDLERIRKALTRIARDCGRASDVLGRIRALVRKTPPQKDLVRINDAIDDVVALTHAEIVKARITCRTQLSPELPVIALDRVQLQQVILNLIMNAVEAMNHIEEKDREIVISTSSDAESVRVSVRDSGPGVEDANRERIFDPFYTTKTSGLGMGLSICGSIIEAHGGRLFVSNAVPRGAFFEFALPVEPPSYAVH